MAILRYVNGFPVEVILLYMAPEGWLADIHPSIIHPSFNKTSLRAKSLPGRDTM